MNAFKAIGTILDSAVTVIVTACTAANRLMQSVDNIAEVVELETSSLKIDSKLESEEKLALGKAKLDALYKRLEEEKNKPSTSTEEPVTV